jgi:hypothetical protein
MQDVALSHTLHFLNVRCLTTIFLVSGLGVKDQHNGLCQVLILLHVILLWCWAKEDIYQQKPKTPDKLEQ